MKFRRHVIPEPPPDRSGMATLEAKSAKCWIITMMMAPFSVIWWIVLLIPMAVPVASALRKPKHTWWWRAAALLSVAGAFALGWAWAFGSVPLLGPEHSAGASPEDDLAMQFLGLEERMFAWSFQAFNFAFGAGLVLLPLAAASTYETWRRRRQQRPG